MVLNKVCVHRKESRRERERGILGVFAANKPYLLRHVDKAILERVFTLLDVTGDDQINFKVHLKRGGVEEGGAGKRAGSGSEGEGGLTPPNGNNANVNLQCTGIRSWTRPLV
jgi:hypothetical protein